MQFEAEPASEHSVIIYVGKALDLDSVEEFKHLCDVSVDHGFRNFILDFSRTGVLDSSGLGAIFALHRQLSSRGKVVFANPSTSVKVVMQITRVYRLFAHYPSIQEACRAVA